jgi:hypothetical protein
MKGGTRGGSVPTNAWILPQFCLGFGLGFCMGFVSILSGFLPAAWVSAWGSARGSAWVFVYSAWVSACCLIILPGFCLGSVRVSAWVLCLFFLGFSLLPEFLPGVLPGVLSGFLHWFHVYSVWVSACCLSIWMGFCLGFWMGFVSFLSGFLPAAWVSEWGSVGFCMGFRSILPGFLPAAWVFAWGSARDSVQVSAWASVYSAWVSASCLSICLVSAWSSAMVLSEFVNGFLAILPSAWNCLVSALVGLPWYLLLLS